MKPGRDGAQRYVKTENLNRQMAQDRGTDAARSQSFLPDTHPVDALDEEEEDKKPLIKFVKSRDMD